MGIYIRERDCSMFYVQIREKSNKKGDKMGGFLYSILSYDRDKKNEREYWIQEGEPADIDLLHTDVVQLIGGRFFIGQNGRRTFPYLKWPQKIRN